jgi:hypothetical protein
LKAAWLFDAYVPRRLFEFGTALLVDNANGCGVGKRIPGDYAVAVGHDDCARLREAAIVTK